MQAAQTSSRRNGSVATESEARQPPSEDPFTGRSTSTPRGGNSGNQRSQSTSKRGNNGATRVNIGDGSTAASTSRAGSQPKQRGSGRAASVGKNAGDKTATATPSQTPFEMAMAKMEKAATGKSEDQLELLLQQLLQQRQFEDAAYLIASAPPLEAKYKASDVIRLLLDIKQFDKAAQLIRDMKLHHHNQLLVTLFIKELVREGLFQSAVRYSQEMVQNFGKSDCARGDQARPSWTPQALIQAMVRAQQFRSALKYAKQFELLELFPPSQLIASMFDVGSWDEGVSSVLEFRLFTEFPLELLIQKLLQHRQWSNAVKCINKLSSKERIGQYNEALVRETARVGDFVTSLRYLREFKLDQPESINAALLKYFVDCMIAHGELYKAIKYAIKFGLNAPPPDAEETGETSVYDTELLIRKAIDCGQYHVASAYIKKLKLHERFTKELEMITQFQERMLLEFHQFVSAREMQFQHPHVQGEIAAILGANAIDETVDQRVETEIVLSMDEEIVPRKPRKSGDETACTVEETRVEPQREEKEEFTVAVAAAIAIARNDESTSDAVSEAPRRSSRFSFARATDSPAPPPPVLAEQAPQAQSAQPMPTPVAVARAPPPGLVPVHEPSAAAAPLASFNFAQFAADLQPAPGNQSTSARPQPPQPSTQMTMAMSMPMAQQQQQQQPPGLGLSLGHLFPHQPTQPPPHGSRAPPPGGFYPPPPPPFNGMMPGHHGYPGPLPPPQQQRENQQQRQAPPPTSMYFPHGNNQPTFSNGTMPLPPPPPPPLQHHQHAHAAMGSNGSSASMAMNQSFDVSSLAMQFHARPQAPQGLGFGGAFGPPRGLPGQAGPGGQGPPPPFMGHGGPPPMPSMPPGAMGGLPGGLFPSMGPPLMQQPLYPPHQHQQQQSTFKPSMSYTSVTTTRQKKG